MAEKDATTRLRRAVKENNLFLVKRLCKKTDLRNPDPTNKRYTSLAWAAVLGHEETFEFLLGEGHDDQEYSKDSDNNTILILLADSRPPLSSPHFSGPSEHEFYSATLRMARLYYDRYPDILDWANTQGRTALHVASLKGKEELVRMLCDLSADIDLADDEGNTSLHYASAWGHIPIVQLLIERGCQYSVRNNEGFTPSDYAYSTNTKDVLQDTARAQFELNKRTRRNVFAQAAAKGHDWCALAAQIPPQPPPRMYRENGVRMRSGSGASRTTTTSDSNDPHDSFSTPQPSKSHSTLSSSLSPSRPPIALPVGHSPIQNSGTSNGSGSAFSALPSPAVVQSHQHLSSSFSASSTLSPFATRVRERDADAMEKYKNRQRSGSGATSSTDTASHIGVGNPAFVNAVGDRAEDDVTALNDLVTTGSVAPRRNLRPSVSAAQLRSPASGWTNPSSSQLNSQDALRSRAGTGPSTVGSGSAQPPADVGVDIGFSRAGKPGIGGFPFAPKDAMEPAPRPSVSGATTPTVSTQTRRLPFNILSSHHKHNSEQGGNHKRNVSLGTKAT